LRPDVAYRLLQLHYDVRATKPELVDPRRDGDLDLLPFLDVPRTLPRGSGDTRRAALRPSVPAPVLVPLGCPSLPNRDADANASPPRRAPRSIVRIYAHGSKDRAKDASPRACDDLSCLRGCVRMVAHADGVPLLGALRTSAVIGAPAPREDTRERRRTDLGQRSDDAPRRAPPSSGPGCLSPSRTRRKVNAKGLLPPAFAPALSLTPPTLAALRGRCS
jgi:hypothetical protein